MNRVLLLMLVAVALPACGTTLEVRETTPVAVTAPRPAPPPPPVVQAPPPPPVQRVQVEATRIRVDEKIHFELNSAVISSESNGLLDEIARVILEHPNLTKIRIEGHTDRQGSAGYNRTLSQRRAQAVLDYLVGKGIARERLESQGFGFDRPLGDNDTEDGRAQNRRVEFNIVEQQEAAPTPVSAPEGGAQ